MTDDDIARVNAAGALDFAVESATPDRMVVIGFVDEPKSLRVRIVFDEPLYVQMPWRFSGRTAERRSTRDLLATAPTRARWELPDRQTAPTDLPSLSFEQLREADQEHANLWTFVSQGSAPSEPPCFVLARRTTVVTDPKPGGHRHSEASPGGDPGALSR
jgi:hypothetical protein